MITVAIPTYNRGTIVVETINRLLALTPPPDAIVIADQTLQHPAEVEAQLKRWNDEMVIRWMRFDAPSIPHAMNAALFAATTPLVLFLDDDVEPSPQLIAAHTAAHESKEVAAVVGQILQPGESPDPTPPPQDALEFRFNHDRGAFTSNVMAGNLSLKRDRAIAVGGFDENYIGAAYRFETDFALRLTAAGGRIWFEPRASLRHLKLASGGLRSYGDHKTTASPAHTVGDYYFAIYHRPPLWRYAMRRLAKNVITRYHATHPWTIPTKLIGELRGITLARQLARRGRKLGIFPTNPALP